jgi:hypothetical protein
VGARKRVSQVQLGAMCRGWVVGCDESPIDLMSEVWTVVVALKCGSSEVDTSLPIICGMLHYGTQSSLAAMPLGFVPCRHLDSAGLN